MYYNPFRPHNDRSELDYLHLITSTIFLPCLYHVYTAYSYYCHPTHKHRERGPCHFSLPSITSPQYLDSQIVPRPLTPQSNLLPIPVQREGYRYERNTQEPQKTTRPIDAQVVVHGGRKQGKTRTEGRTHEIVTGEHGSGIFGVRVAEITEHGVEEEKGADGEPAGADDGHDPGKGGGQWVCRGRMRR